MAYLLRPMHREDIAQVTEIDLACFPTMRPATSYQTELINPLARYIVVSDDPSSIGAKVFITGFAGLWLLAGEAHVINLAVREKYREKGLGELLFMGLIRQALRLEASMITLEVRPSNTTAQALYKKYGLTERGRRRAYYTDNREDAIIMTLDNPSSAEHLARLRKLQEDYKQKWSRDIALQNDEE